MKLEYKELLNVDIDQIEPVPLSNEVKLHIKAHVLSKSKNRKRVNVKYMAASFVLGAGILTTSFITFPAVANQIPFIQNIMAYFGQDTLPNEYNELAKVINQVQTSNGIDVMVENAVYDGTNIILTYAIQTDVELGDHPRAEGNLDVEPSTGMGGTGKIEKINDTTYVGVEEVTPHFEGESPEEILVKWEPLAFKNYETEQRVAGDWKFEFKLGQLPTNIQLLNETASQEGITIVMKSIEQSKMTATLEYEMFVDKGILEKWPFVSNELLDVTDNLGNVYVIHGNGGVSQDNGATHKLRGTIYSLNPDATSLTFTPQIYYSKGSGEIIKGKSMKPITIPLKK